MVSPHEISDTLGGIITNKYAPPYILSFISLSEKIIKILTTKYFFYKNHLTIQRKLFNIHKNSIVYNQITNLSTKMNIWDRISNGGKIILHTAEDVSPDLELLSIKNTQTIEKKIHTLIKNTEKREKAQKN